jgi:hypothetical protein
VGVSFNFAVTAVTAGTIHRINALRVTASVVVAVTAVTVHGINKMPDIENLNQDDITLSERSGSCSHLHPGQSDKMLEITVNNIG